MRAPLPHPAEPAGVVLVTGGSRGIGAATARLAAARGLAVGVVWRDGRAAAAGVVEAIDAAGGRAVALRCDVAVEAEVVAAFDALAERFGAVTGLVTCAAVLDRQMPLEAMRADRMERILRVNVLGTLLCSREAVRRMAPRHGGRGGAIVHVSSLAARTGSPGEYVDYAASKGAIDTLTVGLAREVAADGIRVNAVRPGIVATGIHASGGEPGRAERLGPGLPMGRSARAEEVASAVVWLLSEEASYVSGAVLDVGGAR